LGENSEVGTCTYSQLVGHLPFLLRGPHRMGTDQNGLYDKDPSVIETHTGQFHRSDAHDKTECSARILVAQTASSQLVLAWDHGKEIRCSD
jgi:hypothetical protein